MGTPARAGIVSYGAYVPYHRLSRSVITEGIGAPAGSGKRAVAAFDEDTTSMAVEAARLALRGAPAGWAPRRAVLRHRPRRPTSTRPTPRPSTPRSAATGRRWPCDLVGVGPQRRRAPCRLAASTTGTAARRRRATSAPACPASPTSATAATPPSAFVFGPDGTGTRHRRVSSARRRPPAEFLDRWRLPGESDLQAVGGAVRRARLPAPAERPSPTALKAAGLAADELDQLVVVPARTRRAVRRRPCAGRGAPRGGRRRPRRAVVGNTGTAHAGLVARRRARPGRAGPDDRARVDLADGVRRAAAAAPPMRSPHHRRARHRAPSRSPAGTTSSLRHVPHLAGLARPEPPRRPEPGRPPPRRRCARDDWKFGFVGSRWTACGTRPPAAPRVSSTWRRGRPDGAGADGRRAGTVATFTVDRLAYSPEPARRRGGRRLRRRRPVPVRAHRRRPGRRCRSATGSR